MEVFSFSDDDLKILCENQIKYEAGADTKKEAALFERVANRARGISTEIKQLAQRMQEHEVSQAEVRELAHQVEATDAGADPEDPACEYPLGGVLITTYRIKGVLMTTYKIS